jgi:hypothetical protein
MTKALFIFAILSMAVFAEDYVTIEDKTTKNPDINAAGHTNGCAYVRRYTVRKPLTIDHTRPEEGQPKSIYFHNLDCLDMNLDSIRDTFTEFSYDDDLLPQGELPHLTQLPEGCPPTLVARKPTICENGVKLGSHIVTDVTEVLTKQIAENPANLLTPEAKELLESEDLTQVAVDLESLQEDIAKLVNSTHDDIENVEPEVEEFPNGVVAKTYTFPNSTIAVVARPGTEPLPQPGTDNTDRVVEHRAPYTGTVTTPEGETINGDHTNGLGPEQAVPGKTMLPTNMEDVPEGFYHSTVETVVHNDDPENTVKETILLETMTTEEPPRSVTKRWIKPAGEEDFTYTGQTERVPNVVDNSSYSEQTTNPEGETTMTTVDSPLRFNRPEPSSPLDIPAEFLTSVGNVTEEFSDKLQDLVSSKAECMLDQIFHQKTYKIELVCAKTAAEDEHSEILKNELVKQLFCGDSCDDFLLQVRDQMMDHINAGGLADDFKIKSKTYVGDIVAGAAN